MSICDYLAVPARFACCWPPRRHFRLASGRSRTRRRKRAKPLPQRPSIPRTRRLPAPTSGSGAEGGAEINASLQSEVDALETERAQFVQVQTALTSGLIGAIVTALVAIGGAIASSRNSRPDRDLKRLAVLEKARELQGAGVRLPDDIAQAYGVSSAGEKPP